MKLGLFDKGLMLQSKMSELGLQPDVVTYYFMICVYCKEGKVDCALKLFNSMSSFNLTPSTHSYIVLTNALYNENRLVEAPELYKKMLDSSGVVPDDGLILNLMKKQPKGLLLQLAVEMLHAVAKNGFINWCYS